ncbi:MAG: methyltransferase domain-containing protein [Alphaproteobacteria bacterium]|nr:methyltransferase domain-containing protein [Alphaproteobacteria bacterium]
MVSLHNSAQEWERNAQADALWAVLSDSTRTSQAWRADEFFATGKTEARIVVDHLDQLGIRPDAYGQFLDFGCGVGRVTRALMAYFSSGIGLDVSATMIEQAKSYSALDERSAYYAVSTDDNLGLIRSASVDFVYSHIVLQHMPQAAQLRFIREFTRVLKPGGVAAFQIPSGQVENLRGRTVRAFKRGLQRSLPSSLLSPLRRALGKNASVARVTMAMTICPEATIRASVYAGGCGVVDAPFTNSTDPDHRGEICFMTEDGARAAIRDRKTVSPYLSQFFFIRKGV